MSTEIRNIVMDFNGFKALNGISLKIQDGEFIAVLGPSGCGKTTLLRLLAGFTPPSSGEIRIGEPVVANRDYVLPPNERFISMVFQSYALWPHMSVRKNVEFPIKNSKFVSPEIRSNCDSRVQELIGMVGLTGMEKRLPAQLTLPCRSPKGHSLFQNSTTTARMAPSWMTTRNMDMNSSLALNLTTCSTRIM